MKWASATNSKDVYHGVQACPSFPTRAVEATNSLIEYHNMRLCSECRRLLKERGVYDYTIEGMYGNDVENGDRQRIDNDEPWRYECPKGHTSVREREDDRGKIVYQCVSCEREYGRVWDKKRERWITNR